MKNSLVILLIIFSTFCIASGETVVNVQISTGKDDLRSGSTVRLQFGRLACPPNEFCPTRSEVVSRGMAGGINARPVRVTFTENFTASQIRSIAIRHDGSPRAGFPLDTYDNWDLKALRVFVGSELIYDSDKDLNVFNGIGFDGVHRFTGSSRSLALFVRAAAREPDFVITQLRRDGTAVKVTVRNNGNGVGTIENIRCRYSGGNFRGNENVPLNWPLSAGAEQEFSLNGLRPGRGSTVGCSVRGVDAGDDREMVTTNNALSRSNW